jgi:HNH endonuclease
VGLPKQLLMCVDKPFRLVYNIVREGLSVPMPRVSRESVVQGFWACIVSGKDVDACWGWNGSLDKNGYGWFMGTGRTRVGLAGRASKVMWTLVNGEIPEGMCVCHECDNPPCCNPLHLFLGTVADNNRDRDEKGRRRHTPPHLSKQAKLNWSMVDEIRSRYRPRQVTMRTLADDYGVTPEIIRRVVSCEAWKDQDRPRNY